MLVLINTNILALVLDLKVFRYQTVVDLVRIVFGTGVNSFVHINNKKKDIFVIGIIPTNGSDDVAMTEDKECSTNFTEQQKKSLFKLTL